MQIAREKILEEITIKLAKDNGRVFTDTSRLDYIKRKLEDTNYEILHETSLSVIYKKKNVELPENIVLISTHIDCKNKDYNDDGIYNPDFIITNEGNYKGTFDNAATNAAIVIAMIENKLAENIVIAFTGDEEENCEGAKQVIGFLEKTRKKVISISLDVTFNLVSEKDAEITTYDYASYTIDNLCSNTSESIAKALFECANKMSIPYMITRVDDDCGEDYFNDHKKRDYYDKKLEVEDAAYEDEAITYSKNRSCIGAFSLCLPTNDKEKNSNMHSDILIEIKKKSFNEYIDAVIQICNRMVEV